MLPIILIAIYIVGIIVWMKIEKKYFPYEEGDYTIEFDGAHEITPEIYDSNVQARAIIWPLCLCLIIVLLPFKLINIIYNKL